MINLLILNNFNPDSRYGSTSMWSEAKRDISFEKQKISMDSEIELGAGGSETNNLE